MFKGFFSKYRMFYCAHIPGITSLNAYDKTEVEEELEPKTGVERVITAFQKDKHGELKKEVISAIQISTGSAIMLGFYGGFKYTKFAFENWVTVHATTRFRTGYEAKRALNDHLMVEFCKHFFIYAAKGFMFSSILMFTIIAVSAFRNKDGFLEYTTGGLVAGSLMRINYGLRGMISGATVGGVLGTVTGLAANLLMKLGNFTLNDVREWQYDIQKKRSELYKQGQSKIADEEDVISRSLRHYTTRLTQVVDNEDDDGSEKVFVLVKEEEKSGVSDGIPSKN